LKALIRYSSSLLDFDGLNKKSNINAITGNKRRIGPPTIKRKGRRYIGEMLESSPSEIIPKPQMVKAINPMPMTRVLGFIGSEGCLSVVCSSSVVELGMRRLNPATPPRMKGKPKTSRGLPNESMDMRENKITNPK
jgi:hypothetical protein